MAAAYPDDVDKFPFPITQEILDRGQERFQIFCSVCHGMTGKADGMIVRRGFRKPPSYHEQRLREAPVGHFFDVVTNGWGAMPSYASQVPVQDRWAIIAYIRALQLSQAGRATGDGNQRRSKVINTAYTAPPEVARFQRVALIVGVVALIFLGAGAFFEPVQFWRSYLVGYLFWVGIAVGALALLMLQHLTGGGWGLVIRRVLEAATRTLPLMLLLFIPILLGAHSIYSWTHHE